MFVGLFFFLQEKLLNTWAAECNSKFAEIDKYELEIE